MAADDIFGPNLSSLKGTTVVHPNLHVLVGEDPVPPDILKVHHHIVITIDIMFVNKIPFLITTLHHLHFGTIEALPNQQVPTIMEKLKDMIKFYTHQGFKITTILADPEFEPIQ